MSSSKGGRSLNPLVVIGLAVALCILVVVATWLPAHDGVEPKPSAIEAPTSSGDDAADESDPKELPAAKNTRSSYPALFSDKDTTINHPFRAIQGEKIIFLSFDDGPSEYTDSILEILAKYNIQATFFVTNHHAELADMLKREAQEGHEVCVHSYSHQYNSIYVSEEAYWSDFDAMNDVIEQQTGKRAQLFRFPGGSSNQVSLYNPYIMTRLSEQAAQKGYEYCDWNVESGDAGFSRDPQVIADRVLQGLEENDYLAYVLCHDTYSWTVEALKIWIPIALERGYVFLPLRYGMHMCHHAILN